MRDARGGGDDGLKGCFTGGDVWWFGEEDRLRAVVGRAQAGAGRVEAAGPCELTLDGAELSSTCFNNVARNGVGAGLGLCLRPFEADDGAWVLVLRRKPMLVESVDAAWALDLRRDSVLVEVATPRKSLGPPAPRPEGTSATC